MYRFLLVALLPLSIALLLTGCKDATLGPEVTGGIEGVVLDDETEEGLRNVEVTTSPASDVVVTDSEGRFSFAEIEAGDYNLRARKSGYGTRSVSVRVRENRTSPVTLFLEEEDEESNARNLTAEVTNFINRTDSNDDTSVRVEYRVRNTGSGTVPEYEVTFRIEASEGGDRLHQIQGELLREEQSDVGDFVVELDGADAVDVQVDELWFEE